MTFADWVAETKTRYQRHSLREATRESAHAFWRGAVRRTADQWVGRPWWTRGDWDVLVVLDACRVDLAHDVINHDVQSVWSPASTSIDWITRHFSPGYADEWRTSGYVTANPFADHDEPDARTANLRHRDLGYLDLVYERAFQDVNGIKTTPPEDVTDAAIYAWRNEDIDRLIVHYMQPHQPFRTRPDWEREVSNLENLAGDSDAGGPDIWKRCRDGDIPRDELWSAYRDNLEWVWNDVQDRLLRNLDASVTVTADHGNALGEWGCWSHPPGTIVPSVRKVPVWTVQGVDEETVAPDAPADASPDSGVDAQLEALGYK